MHFLCRAQPKQTMFQRTLLLIVLAIGSWHFAASQNLSHNPEFREAFLHSIRGLSDWKVEKKESGWSSKFEVPNFNNTLVSLPSGRMALKLTKTGNSLSAVKAHEGRNAPFLYASLPVSEYEKVEETDTRFDGGKKTVYRHRDKSKWKSTPTVETGYVQLGFESWEFAVYLIEPEEKNEYKPEIK